MIEAMALGGAAGAFAGRQLDRWIGAGFSRSAQKREFRHQEAMAQNAITWRVQDAIRAGVHPVYALGAAVPSGSSSGVGAGTDVASMMDFTNVMGQAPARVGEKSRYTEEMEWLNLRRARAGTRQAEIAALEAEKRFRNTPQIGIPGGGESMPVVEGQAPVMLSPPDAITGGRSLWDLVQNEAPRISARDSSSSGERTAGRVPGQSRSRLTSGMEFDLPSKDISESLESVADSVAQQVLWYNINRLRHKGRERHFDKLFEQETGVNPDMINHITGLWNAMGRSVRNWRDAAEATRLFFFGPPLKYRGPSHYFGR